MSAKISVRVPVCLLAAIGLAIAVTPTAGAAGVTRLHSLAAVAAGSRPALGTVFVVDAHNEGNETIAEFGPGQHGNVAPIATIAGSHAALMNDPDIAVTPAGGLVLPDADSNSIQVFAPGAHGNVAPARTIVGPKTKLAFPDAVALAGNGAIWVAMGDDDGPSAGGALLEFAPGAHGNVAPIRDISGPKANLIPSSIALTPDGKHLWVARFGETFTGPNEGAIQEFSTRASGDVAAVRTIAGDRTTLEFPQGLMIDAAGEVTVSDQIYGEDEAPGIVTFAANAHGNAKPVSAIAGSKTGLDQPGNADLSAIGEIWEPNYDANTVIRFAPAAHGNVAPTRTLAGAATGLTGPAAVAVFVLQPTSPRSLHARLRAGHRIRLTWRGPASTGGGLLGYQVFGRTSAHGTWKLVATTKRRSFTARRASKGRRSYRVSAYNERGTSPRSRAVTITAH